MKKTDIEMNNINKWTIVGSAEKNHILKNINLEINNGEFVSIVGPSGSGKTTLLQIMSGLSYPNSGEVVLLGKNTKHITINENARLRSEDVGFVFQSYNLIEYLSVFENITLPLRISKRKIDHNEVYKLLDELNFKADPKASIDTLSGGEKQKVALARVFIMEPKVVFADEPTGAVDSVSSKVIFDFLRTLSQRGITVVVVTHDLSLASITDKSIILMDGEIIDLLENPDIDTLKTLLYSSFSK